MRSLACATLNHDSCEISYASSPVLDSFTCDCSCHSIIQAMAELGRLALEAPLTSKQIIFEPTLTLELKELRVLYRIFEHQYISYEDLEAHEVLRKISQTIAEYDKAMTDESTNKLAR